MICSAVQCPNVLISSPLFGLVFLCTHYRLSPCNNVIPFDQHISLILIYFEWYFHFVGFFCWIDFGWNFSDTIFSRRTISFTRIFIELSMILNEGGIDRISNWDFPSKCSVYTQCMDTLFTVSVELKLTEIHVHTYRLNGFHYSNHIIPEEGAEIKKYITSHSSIL